jgi:hypothetical protein
MSKIAYDKNKKEFFCKECGKAGFKTIAQARGHLSQCPKRIKVETISVPVSPLNPLNSLSPSTLIGGAGAGGSGSTTSLEMRLREIDERLKKIETYLWNESIHRMAVQRQENLKWAGLIVLGILGLFFLIKAGKTEKAGEYLIKKSFELL